jgi:site-specific recombinase XerD
LLRGIDKFDIPYCQTHICNNDNLGNGVPIDSVSKMLWHTNLIQTQHYAKVLDTKVSEDMQQLRSKLKEF